MKLLHIATARSIWIFPLLDLNPRGQSVSQEAIDKISERYVFKDLPTVNSALAAQKKNEPVHFGAGVFKSTTGVDVIVDLNVYNDGFIADARSNTKDTERFLSDIWGWLPEALRLPKTTVTISKKLYVSEVIVESEHILTLINPKLNKIAEKLVRLVPKGSATSYEPASLGFATDPKDGTPLLNFKFERQINVPFGQNRYYSSAPIHTDDHLELLEGLERSLTG